MEEVPVLGVFLPGTCDFLHETPISNAPGEYLSPFLAGGEK
jgi:hypothetical protein